MTVKLLPGLASALWLAACAAPGPGEPAAGPAAPESSPARSPRALPAPVLRVADGQRLGNEQAAVVVIEFSDYQCPYCARLHFGVMPQLKEHYITSGKVLFIHRDLPLPMHKQAGAAAVVARCAGVQGKFWSMHDALFFNQSRLAPAVYAELARDLNLDVAQFNLCLNDLAQREAVRHDLRVAQALGIRNTPTVLICRVVGERLEVVREARGVPKWEDMARELDRLLAATK
jgi:protein-disulfide isomerase